MDGDAPGGLVQTEMVNLKPYGLQQWIRKEQFDQIHEAFSVFDRDGGGEVENDELGDVFKSMGMKPSDKQIAELVLELDEDRSGTVSFAEFLKLMVAPKFGSAAYKLIKSAVMGATMVWSAQHVAFGIRFNKGRSTAMRTDFWQIGSVRGDYSLPRAGQSYFEVTFHRKSKFPGEALNGWYYVGLCSQWVEMWDGLWRDDNRRENCWALRSETCKVPHVKVNPEKKKMPFGQRPLKGVIEKRSCGEICSPATTGTEWIPGSSWGNGDTMGVFLDVDKRTMFFYKNGELLDEIAAVRNIPPGLKLFPFVTLTHSDASATIAFKSLPRNKPSDRVPVSDSGTATFYTDWSKEHKAESITVLQPRTRAALGSTSVHVDYCSRPVAIQRPLSVRGVNHIKSDGTFYYEVAISMPGRRQGTSLQGGCYVGVCGEMFQAWDGVWEFDEELRTQVWALHDSFATLHGEITTEQLGARRRWVKGIGLDGVTNVGYGTIEDPSGHTAPMQGFGCGDRIGFHVTRSTVKKEGMYDEDTTFKIDLFKNGTYMGMLAHKIQIPSLWPFVTLSPQEGMQVEIMFPPRPELP